MDEPRADDGELARLLQERADDLRVSYPPGLEHELEQHWRQVRPWGEGDNETSVEQAVEKLTTQRFAVPDVEATSSMPGGAAVHRLITKSVGRQLDDLVGQLDAYAELIVATVGALARALEDGQAETRGQLAAMTAELADLRRAVNAWVKPE
jgi:hypothetical protein